MDNVSRNSGHSPRGVLRPIAGTALRGGTTQHGDSSSRRLQQNDRKVKFDCSEGDLLGGQSEMCAIASNCRFLATLGMTNRVRLRFFAFRQVKKLAAVFFVGNRASVVLAEDAVTTSHDEIVFPISQPAGQHSQRDTQDIPSSAEFSQDYHGSVGLGCEALVRLGVVEYNVHSVEIRGSRVVAPQYRGREVALQGGKAETILRIMLQNEMDEAVAEDADAVVENDGVGVGNRHIASLLWYAVAA